MCYCQYDGVWWDGLGRATVDRSAGERRVEEAATATPGKMLV